MRELTALVPTDLDVLGSPRLADEALVLGRAHLEVDRGVAARVLDRQRNMPGTLLLARAVALRPVLLPRPLSIQRHGAALQTGALRRLQLPVVEGRAGLIADAGRVLVRVRLRVRSAGDRQRSAAERHDDEFLRHSVLRSRQPARENLTARCGPSKRQRSRVKTELNMFGQPPRKPCGVVQSRKWDEFACVVISAFSNPTRL